MALDKKSLNPLLRWLWDLLALYSTEEIIIPGDFPSQIQGVKDVLKSDVSGIVNSILDFAIKCANVNYQIETENPNLAKKLNDWLFSINEDLRGKIPTGINALAKEYFRERWKGGSLLLLRTLWEKVDGYELPNRLWFIDGANIKVENGDSNYRVIGEEKYLLKLTQNKTKPLPAYKNELIFVQKPFSPWSVLEPTPFIIQRGLYKNLKIFELVNRKSEKIIAKAVEYLFVLKKGTEQLALKGSPEFVYNEEDLKKVKKSVEDMIAANKTEAGTPSYITNFDTTMEHLIPEYSRVLNEALYAPLERRLLSGLGLIDIIQGITTTRREAVLNPKPFIEEIKQGIEDFKSLVLDILKTIAEKNNDSHRKYFNSDIQISSSPISAFITDDIRNHLRSMYDRGNLSHQTYMETVGEVDFTIEVQRRKDETKEGLDETLYPPVTQNVEGRGMDLLSDVIPTDKQGPETKNYKGQDLEELITAEVTANYIRLRQRDPDDFQRKSFKIIVLSASKGIKAVIGRLKGKTTTTVQSYLFDKTKWTEKEAQDWVAKHKGNVEKEINFYLEEETFEDYSDVEPYDGTDMEFLEALEDFAKIYEEAPYKTNSDLPPAVRKYPSGAQTAFRKAFNAALKFYKDETKAFKVAWSVLKKYMSHKSSIETQKEQIENSSILNDILTMEKLDLTKKQKKLVDKLLKEKDENI